MNLFNNPLRRALKLLTMFLLAAGILAGCADPVRDHAVKTFFFDGVPALPSLDVLCEENMEVIFNDYYEARIEETFAGAEEEGIHPELGDSSIHPPFRDKNCTGCHDFQKENLLLLPKNELCFKCHKDFIKGVFVHGPVAVADCLACHFPHQSSNSSLLKESRNNICGKCHRERRQAESMHIRVIENKMFCVDCHDPHSGMVHFFLK